MTLIQPAAPNLAPISQPLYRGGHRINIAYLDHTALLGGGEIALLNLVSRVDTRQYNPLVILFSDGPLRQRLLDAQVPVVLLPLEKHIIDVRKDTLGRNTLLRAGDMFRSARFVLRLAHLLNRRRIDLVHSNSLKADILGGAAAKLAGIPVIWHVRDRIEDDYLPVAVARLFRLLARWLPNHVIANSAATLDTLHLPSLHRGSAVYSGIDMPIRAHVVHDGTHPLPTAERKSGLHTGTPMIGLVGRISPWKGQHIFIRAASQVCKKFPSARFQIIGSAMFDEKEYENEIRWLTVTLGLTQSVEFLGFRNDIRELIADMDILVHASTTGEPFGQVIVEGMAAGKPVVATAGGGVPEIVLDGVTGLLVPMGDSNAMSNAICKLLENPQLAAQMGEEGLRRAEDRFTIAHTVREVEKVYHTILKPRAPRLAT